MITLAIIVVVIFVATKIYMSQSQFGSKASGERLATIEKAENFKDGKFENIEFTPQLTEGYTMFGVIKEQFFNKADRKVPNDTIPSVKTDLKKLDPSENVLVWFGHSSYYIQLDGVRFLVDPVFSGNASPIPGTVKSFAGTDIYDHHDFPDIDYLLISHDHYDHTDHKTLKNFRPKISQVICGLGVGAHFEGWHADIKVNDSLRIYTQPSRHFSGRGFSRNVTLWQAYVLETKSFKMYIGGDSGYGSHFKGTYNDRGSMDFAILENGQYNDAWHEIHMHPPELWQAAQDLHAKRVMPVHSSKFDLANHAWDEPLSRVAALNEEIGIPLVTPIIGQVVYLDSTEQSFDRWWEGLE